MPETHDMEAPLQLVSSQSSVMAMEKLKKDIQFSSQTGPGQTKLAEDGILPFDIDYLTPSMIYELEHTLNETEANKSQGLDALRKLIKDEENLVCRDEDNFLLQYLRARKYNVDRAFKLLQSYYHLIKEYESIYRYSQSTADSVRRVIFKNYTGFLTSRDRSGSVVMLFKIGMWNPDEDSFEDVFQAISGCAAHAIEIPATQVTGFRVIMDFRNLTWKHFKSITPKHVILLIKSSQFCFPGRYKGFHIIGENKFFHLLWTACYPFLTRKIRSRVHLHGLNLKALQEFIDPTVLPEEFGGLGATFNNSSWSQIINRVEPKMMEMLKFGYK